MQPSQATATDTADVKTHTALRVWDRIAQDRFFNVKKTWTDLAYLR